MWMNLLTSSRPEGYRKVEIPEAALYALIGLLVVFAGISFLILIVWLVGKIMNKNSANTSNKGIAPVKEKPSVTVATSTDSDEVDEETLAVIMAALMAYYQTNNPKCEFTLKRIKRIRRNDYA